MEDIVFKENEIVPYKNLGSYKFEYFRPKMFSPYY